MATVMTMVMTTAMAMKPDATRKSQRLGWGIRAPLALLATILGGYAVTRSAAQVLAKSNVELAHRLAPEDGRITGQLAWQRMSSGNGNIDPKRIEGLARKALQQDPTVEDAVLALGLNPAVKNDAATTRRLLRYAQTLSRRNAQTQLWAIEDAVSRNDIAGTVYLYDVTLRTKPSLSTLLYPVLIAASTDASIRAALVRRLATQPGWTSNFLQYAADYGENPMAVANLFILLGKQGVTAPPPAQAALINALIGNGAVDKAWEYYAQTHAGADRRRSRDPHFNANPNNATPFDWVPVDDGDGRASIQQDGQGRGIIDFSAFPNAAGPLLRQVQFLTTGQYRLRGRSSGERSSAAQPYWVLKCADGRESARIDLPAPSPEGRDFRGDIAVPAGCPIQTLVLMARASNTIEGVSGQIQWVRLEPAP